MLKQKTSSSKGKIFQQAYKSAAQRSPRNSDENQNLVPNIVEDYSKGPSHQIIYSNEIIKKQMLAQNKPDQKKSQMQKLLFKILTPGQSSPRDAQKKSSSSKAGQNKIGSN